MSTPQFGNIVEWLSPDARRLWLTSFTVDEHEAFALVYRALGGRVPLEGVRIAYHRRGFRRAGRGAMPRRWMLPVDVPSEVPLPNYHPKLILAETGQGHVLVVSTGNLATDDLRGMRNLAVRLDVENGLAKRVAQWVERPPRDHRALCILVGKQECQILPGTGNRATLKQIYSQFNRCSHCKTSGAKSGEWIVAAPFWSPATITRLFALEPKGRVEAYFRVRTIWDQLAAALPNQSDQLRRVKAYALHEGKDPQRWHHKVIAWRCCDRVGARSALYVGSANATVCGLVGSKEKAINWEAGVLWLGGTDLWKHARDVARAGFSAASLGLPKVLDMSVAKSDDELGASELDELERIFTAYAAQSIRVKRKSRKVIRCVSAVAVRALGRKWGLDSLAIRIERGTKIGEFKNLKPGACVNIPPDGRAQVRAVFKISDGLGAEEPSNVPVSIDVTELDPEPPAFKVTRQSSIAAALTGLTSGWNGSPGGNGKGGNKIAAGAVPSDVRFPFGEYFALKTRRPEAASAWLHRLQRKDEGALEKLPEYWRSIAATLGQLL